MGNRQGPLSPLSYVWCLCTELTPCCFVNYCHAKMFFFDRHGLQSFHVDSVFGAVIHCSQVANLAPAPPKLGNHVTLSCETITCQPLKKSDNYISLITFLSVMQGVDKSYTHYKVHTLHWLNLILGNLYCWYIGLVSNINLYRISYRLSIDIDMIGTHQYTDS